MAQTSTPRIPTLIPRIPTLTPRIPTSPPIIPTLTPRIPRHPDVISLEETLKGLVKAYNESITNRTRLLTTLEIRWKNGTRILDTFFSTIQHAINHTLQILSSIIYIIDEHNLTIDSREIQVIEDLKREPESIMEPVLKSEKDLNRELNTLRKRRKVGLKIFNRASVQQTEAIKWKIWWEKIEPILKAQNKNRPADDEEGTFTPAAQGGHKKSKRKQGKQSKQSKRRKGKPKKKQTKSN